MFAASLTPLAQFIPDPRCAIDAIAVRVDFPDLDQQTFVFLRPSAQWVGEPIVKSTG